MFTACASIACKNSRMISRPSAFILILANLTPVFGVMLFDWQVIDILILYWTESVVIGVINVMRMIRCQTGDVLSGLIPGISGREIPPEVNAELQARMPKFSASALKLFIIPFFVVHYGGFCAGHLFAVMSFFGGAALHNGVTGSLQNFWEPEYWIAVVAITSSHLYSYFNNYIGANEYQHSNLFMLMMRPYGRITTMHIAIVVGAGLVMWLGSPLPVLIILIVAKTTMDLKLHEKERRKLSATGMKMQSSVSLAS